MGSFTNFPSALTPILQSNFLEREMEEGLDSILAYRREAILETLPCGIGETLTRTRKGRLAPTSTALTPSGMTGLDLGLTPGTFSVEQYTYTIQQYGATVDVNLLQELGGVADQVVAYSRNNGVQAAQSLERIARSRLFGAYLGGNTRVVSGGTTNTTNAHVDDIRGFQNVLVNGVLTAVSGTNTLTVNETATVSGGVTQALTVTSVTADGSNVSTCPDGISGQLVFNAATTPVVGDAMIAANAPQILRPFSKLCTSQLNGQDVLTLGLVIDGVAALRNNGVPPMEDGTYHCILDNVSLRQLWADQDFKVLFAGRDMAQEFQRADVVKLLDVTFIPTTEAYVQNSNGTGAGQVPVRVRRPILMGAESLLQGNFEGMEKWLEHAGVNPIHDVMLINGVAQIVRPPLDRGGQVLSLTWIWAGDFAVPIDSTATSTIIPTASSATFKRAISIEHAG